MANHPTVLAIVQAGGQGSRMDVLTRERAKPVLTFGGTHALIDFALSALAHAGISEVWVSVQYQASSLDRYLAGGRPWDLDRTRGGFRRMVPEEGSGSPHQEGFSHGNADDLYRLRDAIEVQGPDLLVVLSSDHVFNIDLQAVIDRHLERGAECTIVTAEVGVQEAGQNLVVDADTDGVVREVAYKPDSPATGTVATEIFVYDTTVLLEQLDRLRRRLQPVAASDATSDTGLGDFGEHLVPALVGRGSVHAVASTGYWRDVGRPESYLQGHRDLVRGRVDVFDVRERPVIGHPVTDPPGWVGEGAQVSEAMIGPGCRVSGTVRRSVLGPRVEVQAGAVVEDSVLLGDTVIEAGARVMTTIVDTGVRVGRHATVGVRPAASRLRDDDITMVGRDSRVRRGSTVAGGARMEPGSSS